MLASLRVVIIGLTVSSILALIFIGGGLSYKYGIHREILFFYYPSDQNTQPNFNHSVELNPFKHVNLPGDSVTPVFSLAYEGDSTLSPSILQFIDKEHFDIAGGRIDQDGNFNARTEAYSELPAGRRIFYADFDSDKDFDAFVIGKYSYSDQLSDPGKRPQLYLNRGGIFVQSEDFFNLEVICQEEQPVLADFDNDGDVDIFIPCNTHGDEEAHNYLLVNDGFGGFKDHSGLARVQMPYVPSEFRVEGAQAVDIDKDGWLDLYVGSHLFMNNRNLTFSNMAMDIGLRRIFDEGVKFSDVNNDGLIDLIIYAEHSGPKVFINQESGMFSEYTSSLSKDLHSSGKQWSFFGFNMHDLNNDGFEDIILGKEEGKNTHIFVGQNGDFHRIESPFMLDHDENSANSPSFADFNGDGKIDFARRVMNVKQGKDYAIGDWMVQIYMNETPTTNPFFKIDLLGQNGERNQQGRIVELRPSSRADFVITRVVDSGSGYLNQNQYTLLLKKDL